ncbi:hypothetical protein ACMU_00975 [Actibacterium mucosum KCTC 23349]|uniref:Uncharacterized protein n=1 Tax=Actibacterium mucosum KCTC 23349 TaxID=1454373 RepID=A0A037ZLW3_9RHOB|nr:hypothetical protein [Actibacterium mucosum]KAJ57094.1 hypothetical protein ACMU_00975 [Actibacterium mucosum KCTC 23349]
MTIVATDITTQILWQSWPQGAALNRWNVTPVEETPFPGKPMQMSDKVTYEFENGWVDTGDLPCRRALRNMLPGRKIACATEGFTEIYVGGDTPEVDYGDFCHIPMLRVRYARVRLQSASAQRLALQLKTAGGVHVWLDDRPVCVFEPFRRNVQQTHTFTVDAPAGEALLTVRFEDLHERDTNYGFELTLLQGNDLQTGLEATGVSAADISSALEVLDGLRTDAVFHEAGTVRITSDNIGPIPVNLCWGEQTGVLSADNPFFDVLVPAGCTVMAFGTTMGPLRLSRSIGTTVLGGQGRINGHDFTTRRQQFLQVADCGDDIAGVLAALDAGTFGAKHHAALDDALEYVERRKDCADFRMMSLLWIWARHAETLPTDQRDRLRAAILGFRYWMDEPGNDVMWFWSENHVLCFHIAQFLAGQMFPDQKFTNSGKSGYTQRERGAERLHYWFDAIDEHGLAEWNSAAYYPINYRALAALVSLSGDSVLTKRARGLLDQISAMVALHTSGGVPAGSQGRIYEKELLAGPMTELGAVAALLFGGGHVPGKDAAAVMLALSGYVPPPGLRGLAYPAANSVVRAQYAQGLHPGQLSLWKSADVQLSSVQDHKPGTDGHQQHVVDMQFAADPLARIWVNQPGDLKTWGSKRPSYWAGNARMPRVAQHGRVVLLHFTPGPDDIPFSHLFVPTNRLDEVEIGDQWVFVRCGQGYGAIYGTAPLLATETGVYAGHEWRQFGRHQGWAIVAGDTTQDGGFDQFRAMCHAMQPNWRHGVLTLKTPDGPLQLAQHGSADLDGAALDIPPEGRSKVPHVSISGGAYVPWTQLQDNQE